MNEKIWDVKNPALSHKTEIDAIAEALNISCVTASLLYNRGQKTPEDALKFVRKETELFHDSFLIRDMDKAVARIMKAVENREKIAVYGDYDVDGVTSVSILYLYLEDKGADVDYYIPSRTGEGYGVNEAAIDTLKGEGVSLIVTVDTGITAVGEIDHASEVGVDVIITDHHECHGELPRAVAVVNPRRPDCDYPFKELAGVGVVFKLICALEQTYDGIAGMKDNFIRNVTMKYGDLVAIGTVADVMPLTDENRLIVSIGMSLIEKNPRPGIAALLELSKTTDKPQKPQKKRKVTSSLIGYVIAPRINAAGRISNASKAVEMFLTSSPSAAKKIASELCQINRERQTEENLIIEDAYRKIEEEHDFKNDLVIVLDEDNWHQGVIGIVSSRITEHYNLPSILISFDGDIGKGSGRSIKGLNLVDALKYCDGCLLKYGGHELAAGLSIERSKLPEFKRRINEYARKYLTDDDLVISVPVDCEIEAKDVSMKLANELFMLEPYGIANPVPVFVLRDAVLSEIIPIGGNRHTKLTVEKDGYRITAVYFGAVAGELEFLPGDRADIMFNLDINDFQNVQTAQMIVRDLAHAKEYSDDLERQRELYFSVRDSLKSPDAPASPGVSAQQIVPLREDFVKVYLYLRSETKAGRDCIPIHSVERSLGGENYVKARLIIDIMSETNLISAIKCADGGPERYIFKLNNITNKINLEKSSIYSNLKSKYGDSQRF